ncbi:MAG: carboxypeptidase regulatory-like domain-containing protein [Vicinamibacteria bacterium]
MGLGIVLSASGLIAQTRTGSIDGTIRDATSQVLPGVSLTLEGPTLVSAQVTTSSEAGIYRFINLPPGIYLIRAELSGFQTLNVEGIRVDIARNTPVDINMQLATVAETVTVIGESPLVDVKSTVTGASFDEQLLAEVPSARDVWSVLEHQAPGVTTNRLDVGGSETGLQALFSARGTSWQQNSYYLNGVNVTCPSALGASGYYYDFDSFEEVQVATGSHPASVNAPGVFLNMVTKTGGNEFRGGGSFYYQNDATQGDNLTDDLQQVGASRGDFDYLSDANAQIGGPIVRDRSTFYFSWRDERVHRFVSGFPEVESTDMWQFLIKNNTQINAKNRVGVEWHHMSYYKPNRGAAANRTPEATWIEDDTF